MVGQGYDGASAMSGCVNGVQTRIRKKAPKPTYVHYASHVLNIVLNMENNVSEIRNMYGTVKSVTNFTNVSDKRREIAKDALCENDGRSLLTLCDTRFVERHDALGTLGVHRAVYHYTPSTRRH